MKIFTTNSTKNDIQWRFFNTMGFVEVVVDSRIGKLREIRLHVHTTESENWAILSEVGAIF